MAKYEGHWRNNFSEESDLPWPIEDVDWPEKSLFLTALNAVEREAENISYRGISLCRLCGCKDGHRAYRLESWEWPAGFRHYLQEHGVRPSMEFETFIYRRSNA